MPDRLVLCLDGTWNGTFQEVEREDGTKVLKPTNPLKVARAVLPRDAAGNSQITYYDTGVGALGVYPGFSNKLLNLADSKLGGAWGAGFEANVEQAANFLANNWSPGTEVYIFGFSRGAAQARAVTRFFDWLGGIPPKGDAYFVPIFFREYILSRGAGDPALVRTSLDGDQPHKRVIRDFAITFLGVWDTVMALGSRFRAVRNNSVQARSFHVGERPAKCVKHARQGLAIDEKRFDFRPQIWTGKHSDQTLEQRWFPGCHGNVGGAYGNDGLANAALHWIADEVAKLGLELDRGFLRYYRPFAQDEIAETYTGMYPLIDRIRFRHHKGARSLQLSPPDAGLSVDSSAVKRLCSDPADWDSMKERYRPAALVEWLRDTVDDPQAFLRSLGFDPAKLPFPDDILE